MKYLVVGDTHIPTAKKYYDHPAVFNWNVLRGELLQAIEKYNPSNIVFLGDVFDPPRISPDLMSPQIFLNFVFFLKEVWDKYTVPFYILKGNHDGNTLRYLEPFKFVKVIEEPYYDEIEKVAFFPYKEIYNLKDYKAWDIKIAFGHVAIGRVKIGSWELAGIAHGEIDRFENSKWFLGHIHHRYSFNTLTSEVIYVGSAYPTNHNDPNEMGYMLINDDLTYEYISIDPEKFITYHTFESIDEANDFLMKKEGKFAIKIRVDDITLKENDMIRAIQDNEKVYELVIEHREKEEILLNFKVDAEKYTLFDYLKMFVEANNFDPRILDIYKDLMSDDTQES